MRYMFAINAYKVQHSAVQICRDGQMNFTSNKYINGIKFTILSTGSIASGVRISR